MKLLLILLVGILVGCSTNEDLVESENHEISSEVDTVEDLPEMDSERREKIDEWVEKLSELEEFLIVYNEYSDSIVYVPWNDNFKNNLDNALARGEASQMWIDVTKSLSNISQYTRLAVDDKISIVMIHHDTDEVIFVARDGRVITDVFQ